MAGAGAGGDIDVPSARAILDEDHYDLEKIKDRILEYLAVRKLRQERERRIATEDADGKASADPSSRRGDGVNRAAVAQRPARDRSRPDGT